MTAHASELQTSTRPDPPAVSDTQSGIFDAHVHIIDPRFPLVPNASYLPQPFTVEDYRRRTSDLGIIGGVIVSGSFQAFDQAYLRDALSRLGPLFVGVTQLPANVSDETVLELAAAGVRGVRCNLYRGGPAALNALETLAYRVYDLAGWHVELYLDGRDLSDLESRLRPLPRLSIDHLGLHRDGLPSLLRLVARGARVKASGFGRVQLDVPSTLRAIAAVDPGALLFGTDLPSTRAELPFADTDIALLRDALGREDASLALRENALAWYRVQVPPRTNPHPPPDKE